MGQCMTRMERTATDLTYALNSMAGKRCSQKTDSRSTVMEKNGIIPAPNMSCLKTENEMKTAKQHNAQLTGEVEITEKLDGLVVCERANVTCPEYCDHKRPHADVLGECSERLLCKIEKTKCQCIKHNATVHLRETGEN